MPELPEVHTTSSGLQTVLPGLRITDAWTDYKSAFHAGKDNIKNPSFFKTFRSHVVGKKVLSVSRVGKNILIHLEKNLTILVHMKMTGHLLYGTYARNGRLWRATTAGPLRDDPFNQWIHFVLTLSNKHHLALSDMRRFAKVTLLATDTIAHSKDLAHIGPDPTSPTYTLALFTQAVRTKPKGRIKSVLMDQALIAGIGNIYSDEILWRAGIHPATPVGSLSRKALTCIFKAIRPVLTTGVGLGGDSTSDYRDIHGNKGSFQGAHRAYQRTGERCVKRGCAGTIARMVIGGRSAHFCTKHQKLLQ